MLSARARYAEAIQNELVTTRPQEYREKGKSALRLTCILDCLPIRAYDVPTQLPA